jgi:hypothetical protein
MNITDADAEAKNMKHFLPIMMLLSAGVYTAVGCQNKKSNDPGNQNAPEQIKPAAEPATPDAQTKESAQQDQTQNPPGALIARVKTTDAAGLQSQIDIVGVKDLKSFQSGPTAAEAFKSGIPFSLQSSAMGLLAVNGGQQIMMGLPSAPGQVPSMIQNGAYQLGYNCNYYTPGCQLANGAVGSGGSFINFIGNLFYGALNTVSNILRYLSPFTWFGNQGQGYFYQGQAYQNGNYQYYPYVPGPVIYQNGSPATPTTPNAQPVPQVTYYPYPAPQQSTVPGQTTTNQYPYPGFYFPTYSNTGYPTPQTTTQP